MLVASQQYRIAGARFWPRPGCRVRICAGTTSRRSVPLRTNADRAPPGSATRSAVPARRQAACVPSARSQPSQSTHERPRRWCDAGSPGRQSVTVTQKAGAEGINVRCRIRGRNPCISPVPDNTLDGNHRFRHTRIVEFNRYLSSCCALCFLITLLCGCEARVETTGSLIDSRHAADVLVERHVLSDPHSVDRNRLLRGWRRFIRQPGGHRWAPTGAESVVEFVNVRKRPRSLEIQAAVNDPSTEAHVRVRWKDRDLGLFEVTDRTTIPLPADLPVGRIAIALEFSPSDGIAIERISVSPCLAPGEVIVNAEEIEQSGWSVVEVVRKVQPGARMVVGFEPPDATKSRQRFAIAVDRGHGKPLDVFSWRSGGAPGADPPASIEVPLGDDPGPLRFRFIGEGEGPAGRWIEPRIIENRASAVPKPSPTIDDPPRLVLLYVMDALRGDHVGRSVDGEQLTPHLDHLTDEGVSFANHFAVAPNTPPSTRALFSGLSMLDDRQLPSPGPTRLAEVYRDAGYRTISITGNPHLAENLDLGTGFESVEMLRVKEDHHPKHPPTINNSAEILHEAALCWIDTLGPHERGFLYIHSMNPHNPYTPPLDFVDRFAPSDTSIVDGRTRTLVAIRDLERGVTLDDIDRLRNLYAAGVAYNDAELGSLLNEIDLRFDPEQTFVAMTSDHGEELFEHGGVLHGFSLYDEMLRIPLILRWTGRLDPRRIDALTNTRDLHATMVDLVGGSADDPNVSSLWNLATGGSATDPEGQVTFAAAPGLAGAVMARSPRWKLIQVPRNGLDRGMGKGRGRSRDVEYVFNLVEDPEELHNLAGTDDLEVAWLRSRLTAWLATQQAIQPTPGDQVMDDETKDQLESLGYIIDR